MLPRKVSDESVFPCNFPSREFLMSTMMLCDQPVGHMLALLSTHSGEGSDLMPATFKQHSYHIP